jgi:predicted RNA-binding protein with PIN domain
MHENIEIDISNADEWVERIGNTAYENCKNRIIMKTSDSGQNIGFIIESNDAGALGCLGWAIEQHLDTIPPKLKPTFQKILEDVNAKKENLERS